MKIQNIDYFYICSINSCIFILINCNCVHRETYNLAKRQFSQNLHRSKMGNLLKKGKEKGRGKGEGGQRRGYLSNEHILDWTV